MRNLKNSFFPFFILPPLILEKLKKMPPKIVLNTEQKEYLNKLFSKQYNNIKKELTLEFNERFKLSISYDTLHSSFLNQRNKNSKEEFHVESKQQNLLNIKEIELSEQQLFYRLPNIFRYFKISQSVLVEI